MNLSLRPLTFAITLLLTSVSVTAGETHSVIVSDGPAFRGELSGAESPLTLRFADDGKPRDVAAANLVSWGEFVEAQRGTQIVLLGGGIVVADAPRIDNEFLRAESKLFDAVSLPLQTVAGIIFRPPLESTKRDQLLARIASPGAQSDRVLLDNGDELTGTIAALDEKVLSLESEVGKVELELNKVLAVIFNPTLRSQAASGVRVWVGFRDGSRAMAVKLSGDTKKLDLELAGGGKLAAATDGIVALQTLGGRTDYLSDIKPVSYKHIPFLELSWPYLPDRSVTGGQMRAGGKLYIKGLGMHSPSRITYNLTRPYRSFQAEVAVDDETGPRGSVVFRVFTDDGSGSWQQRSASEVLRGGESPQPISVDLNGAKRISLLVDYADRGDEMDHADWLNARLVR